MNNKNTPVDRSYHPSKAIREYRDRGMMKWQGFFLSEHTTAMKQWEEEEKLPLLQDDLSVEEKFQLLSQSMLNQLPITIMIKDGLYSKEIKGTVKDLISQEEILVEVGHEKYKRLSVKSIIDIFE